MHPHMRFSLQPLPSRGCGSCQHRRLWNHTQTLVQQRAEEWIKHQFLKWIISEMTVNDFQPPTQIDMKPCFKKKSNDQPVSFGPCGFTEKEYARNRWPQMKLAGRYVYPGLERQCHNPDLICFLLPDPKPLRTNDIPTYQNQWNSSWAAFKTLCPCI